jgi:hypothetical protein
MEIKLWYFGKRKFCHTASKSCSMRIVGKWISLKKKIFMSLSLIRANPYVNLAIECTGVEVTIHSCCLLLLSVRLWLRM